MMVRTMCIFNDMIRLCGAYILDYIWCNGSKAVDYNCTTVTGMLTGMCICEEKAGGQQTICEYSFSHFEICFLLLDQLARAGYN